MSYGHCRRKTDKTCRANFLNLVAWASYPPWEGEVGGLIGALSSPLPLFRFRDWKKKSMPLGVGVQTSSAKGITALQLVIKLRTDFLLLPPPHPTRPPINLPNRIKADTHVYTRGVLLPEHAPGSFCTCQYTRGSVFKFAQFAPWGCSQIFNLLNIVEHFAGWKFCSRGWSISMKSLVHT